MNACWKAFAQEEDGAVTVDWVVLTAAVVGLALFAVVSAKNGSTALGTKINTYMQTAITVGGSTGG
ncbi:hypothetical protein GCM10011517_16700 [Actibacterium pelagium]|uniref:Flp pilus assembly protein, pilin Flp n=1 Tax=Actibacterium pelagium TaxID=2029103 RepID=A0A917AGM3_9RHOB|nr:hypothetical protein [Actibacterium pelagium]GGE49546.1 hypothetical protein GCM10011517_16700 [Actibacterium pelagium]